MHLPILLFIWLALPSLEAKPLRIERSKSWVQHGIAYAEMGADNQASESFSIAYWIDPSNVEPLWRQARLLLRNSEYGRAIECSNKAIALNSRCSEAYAIRGLSRVYLGEQEAAILNFDQAIRYESKAEYYGFRGLAQYQLASYSKAIKDLELCIKLDPSSEVGHANLARALTFCPDRKHRDSTRATLLAVKACELSKWTDWEIIELASMAQAEFGAFRLALELQEKAMKLASYPAGEKEKGEKLIEYYQAEKKPWK